MTVNGTARRAGDAIDDSAARYPAPRGCPFVPEDTYAEQRRAHDIGRVVLPSGDRAWLISRHEHIRAVLTDPRFSADRRKDGFPMLSRAQRALRNQAPSMVTLDGAEHSAARRAVISEFSVKRVAAMEPRIQGIVDELIERMLTGERPADLVTALSLPVPSMVICELLGVPYTDHDFFQERANRLLQRDVSEEQRRSVTAELHDFLRDLLRQKAALPEPPDDLMGRQIARQRAEGSDVDIEALVAQSRVLLVAGHETTANMISLGTLALLRNPEQLAGIRADPSSTPQAVEELLRYFSITEGVTLRLALQDVELGGVLIRKGDGVVGDLLAANHDGHAFDEPAELDLAGGKRHHVAFGFGPHQCLGQNLARKELQIVFDTLFQRIPGMRLAVPVEDIPFKDDTNIYGIYRLPVTW